MRMCWIEHNRILLAFKSDDEGEKRFECDKRSLWNATAGCAVDLASTAGTLHLEKTQDVMRIDYRVTGESLSQFCVSADQFREALDQVAENG